MGKNTQMVAPTLNNEMLHFAYSDVLLLGFTVFVNMCSMKKNESLKTANV